MSKVQSPLKQLSISVFCSPSRSSVPTVSPKKRKYRKKSQQKEKITAFFKITPVKLIEVPHRRGSTGGVTVMPPLVAEILKEEKELQHFNEKLNAALQRIKDDESKIKHPLKFAETASVPLLSCDHLTPDEIQGYFNQYKSFSIALIEGKLENKRHEQFIMRKNVYSLSHDSLTYNTSMAPFSQQQILLLADLCTEAFEFLHLDNAVQYYFKVLMPELCLKIFRNEHCLSREEAIDYLDERPIDDF